MLLRSLLLTTAALVAGAGGGATAALAAPVAVPLTTVASDSPTSAYGGWVVWSERGTDQQWRLVAFHAGVKTTLPVPPRAVPFDADAGPAASGRPAVTFSRCAKEPAQGTPQPWVTARGCDLFIMSLPSGGVARLPVPHKAGTVDGTPSMWHHQVAFQRRTLAHPDVAQLMLYDLKTRRLRTLPHGAVPHGCDYQGGCKGYAYRGEVEEIDLGARTVAFSWRVQSPAVEGVGAGYEMRADRLRDGARLLAGSGYASGACGGRFPASPNATATGLWFLNRVYPCDGVEGTITTASFAAASLSAAPSPAGTVVWRIARDGATTYAVLGPDHTAGDGSSPNGVFSLVRLDGLAPEPTGKTALEPFV